METGRTYRPAPAAPGAPEPTPPPTQAEDFTSFFLEANKHIEETDYHRGISAETLNRFKVGFVPRWRHPKAPAGVPESPRLIIPTSKGSYLARDTRAGLTGDEKKYSKSKVGSVHIFNERALYEADRPVFLVEGEIDALSIIDVGGFAVGLGSVSMANQLITRLEAKRPSQPLIIAMDNDGAGQQTREALWKGLHELEIPFEEQNITGDYKDANEALVADREGFKAVIDRYGPLYASRMKNRAEEDKLEALAEKSVAGHLQGFIDRIADSKNNVYTSTGFRSLDKLLDGGVFSGLYIVGAVSSLGKTTFCLQVADQIAATGRDVLIFSLEMAQDEMMAKSVSRWTVIEDLRLNNSTGSAKSTRGIMTGSFYNSYTQAEKRLILQAIKRYGEEQGSHIFIQEGMGDIGVEDIRAKVEEHARITGKAPVVMIDYLQILAPVDMHFSDKQNCDQNVLQLKRLSRDFKIPIIGISSFNRDNYTAPVDMKSFKESGAIEYSSDVLIGLQYEGMDYRKGEKDKDREIRIRELKDDNERAGREGRSQNIQVKILKNRNGVKGSTNLDFYPMFNYFTEHDESGVDGGGEEWTNCDDEECEEF